MLIKINGIVSGIAEASSIRDLIRSRNLSGDGIIVAVNGDVVKRDQWESVKLKPDDKLELIRIVAGG